MALGNKSVKWLAGQLAEMSKQPIENTQSYVWRWWKTEGITDEWAERLSTALGKPQGHFKQLPVQPPPIVPANGQETDRLLRELEASEQVEQEVVRVLRLLARRLELVERRLARGGQLSSEANGA